jgi:hypothetical protein
MGKTRKKSWSSNRDEDEAEDSIFANNPFIEGFVEYINSPEGELQLEVDDVLWELLTDVHLDPKKRLLLWPDTEQLDIDQSVERIQKLYPQYPHELIEGSLLSWLEMGYEPPTHFSVKQIDELDRLTERWVTDHERRALSNKKRERTSHS